MNKKGQSLVTFLLVLPIIVLFLILFIDVSMMYQEKTRIKGITYDNLKIAVSKDIKDPNKIMETIKKNESNVNINIEINDDDITLHVKENKKNLFGNILKLDVYNIEFKYCANYVNKIIKEC